MITAAFFGTSAVGDAFVLAFRIPNLLRRLVAEGAMSSGFIPIFTEIKEKEKIPAGPAQQFFLTRILSLTLITLSLITACGMLFSNGIVNVFYSLRAETGQAEILLAGSLLRRMFPYLLFVSFAAVIQGVLNTYENFTIPAAMPILLNICIISAAGISVFAEPEAAVLRRAYFLCFGVLTGGAVQFAAQIPWLYRHGFKIKFTINLRDPRIKKFIFVMIPVIFSTGVYQINILFIDPLALKLGDGPLSALYYSLRLQEFPLGIIIVSISTVILPLFSAHTANNNHDALTRDFCRAIVLLTLLVLPITVFSVGFRNNIIFALFASGSFNAESTALTADCFLFHSAAILFIGLNRVFVPLFLSHKDTRTPFIISGFGTAINICAAYCFVYFTDLGAGGLALSGLIMSITVSAAYVIVIRKKYSVSVSDTFVKDSVKLFVAMVPSCACLYFLSGLDISHTVQVILVMSRQINQTSAEYSLMQLKIFELIKIIFSAAVFLAIYGFFIKLFGVSEFQTIIAAVRRRIKSFCINIKQ